MTDPPSSPEGTPAATRPVWQYSVLCDAIAQNPNAKLAIIGLFDSIQFPSVVPQFFIVNKWINGSGAFRESTRLLKPDLSAAGSPLVADVNLRSKTAAATTIHGLVNFAFIDSGVYWVEVKLDDKLVLAYPLPVMQAPSTVQTTTP